jgi:hypothetical protein
VGQLKLVPGAKRSRLIPLNIRDFWFDSRDDCYARISAATFAIKPRDIVASPKAKGRFTREDSRGLLRPSPPVHRNLAQQQPVAHATRGYVERVARVDTAVQVNSTIGKYSDFRRDWGYGGAGVHVPNDKPHAGGGGHGSKGGGIIRWK